VRLDYSSEFGLLRKLRSVNGSGKVILHPHLDLDQLQTLTTSSGSTLAHAYNVWSTAVTVNVFVSITAKYYSEHTDISSNESNHELFRLRTLRPRLWHDVLVQRLHRPLKACKLHHSVWDLTTPQWHDTLVEPDSSNIRTRN